MLAQVIAFVCLGWYAALPVVCLTGYIQLYRHYRSKKPRAQSELLADHETPHVTIIRPIRGLEPELYNCLASTFQQTYPKDKLSIRLCLPSREDAGASTAEHVLLDHPGFDAEVLYEDEDDALDNASPRLGPNPKIRNMSRAYRQSRGDLIWIVDCNVWIAKGVAGRMVDTIEGFNNGTKTKFVHQLPLVEDVTTEDDPSKQDRGPLRALTGSRLEEMFLASSHAKFYTAINTVLIAPCIVGKSNMFRKSHLNELTAKADPARPPGIDFFSYNICEDHLIGDLLWRTPVSEELQSGGVALQKHALVFGDMAIQPVEHMTVSGYIARRVRWLRVRKFTVPAATLVEPGTECFLDSLYGAFAVTTLPSLYQPLGLGPTWASFLIFWLLSVIIWAAMDWTLFRVLHSMQSIDVDENTPLFIRRNVGRTVRPLSEFIVAWLGRESLALYIWMWAIFGGVTVDWRGQKFKVSLDARVHAVDPPGQTDLNLQQIRVETRVLNKSRRE